MSIFYYTNLQKWYRNGGFWHMALVFTDLNADERIISLFKSIFFICLKQREDHWESLFCIESLKNFAQLKVFWEILHSGTTKVSQILRIKYVSLHSFNFHILSLNASLWIQTNAKLVAQVPKNQMDEKKTPSLVASALCSLSIFGTSKRLGINPKMTLQFLVLYSRNRKSQIFWIVGVPICLVRKM